jgi:hypothetical protein
VIVTDPAASEEVDIATFELPVLVTHDEPAPPPPDPPWSEPPPPPPP